MKSNKKLSILVTGAEGFTGKFVCKELIKRNINFTASIKPGNDKSWFLKENIRFV